MKQGSNRIRQAWQGIVLAGLVVSVGCGRGQAGGTASAATTAGAAGEAAGRVVSVSVQTVQPESFADFITVTGSVLADRDVTVASEESGVIREVFVARGARVSADQPIARIDDRLIRAQYEQAVAEAKLARETYERQRRLWEEDSIGSEMAFLRAKYGAETAEASARALSTRLERTTIRAPIGGVLDDRYVEVGSMVAPGTRVARVVDADPLKVRAGVPERYAGEIRSGARAIIEFDNGSTVDGSVEFASSIVDESNRTFVIEASVGNAGGQLKPGMVARMRVARGVVANALLVPRDAILRIQAGYVVYVAVERDGRWLAESRVVETGASNSGKVLITRGLSAGDRVIVVGQHQVANGDVIRMTDPPPAGGRP